MKQCPYCKKMIPSENIFCMYCMRNLNKKKLQFNKKYIYILAICLLAIGICVGIYFSHNIFPEIQTTSSNGTQSSDNVSTESFELSKNSTISQDSVSISNTIDYNSLIKSWQSEKADDGTYWKAIIRDIDSSSAEITIVYCGDNQMIMQSINTSCTVDENMIDFRLPMYSDLYKGSITIIDSECMKMNMKIKLSTETEFIEYNDIILKPVN